MKQLISLVLIFGLLTLAACGTKEEASSSASSEPSLSVSSSSASEQEKAPTPEELLKEVGETHLESSFFDFSLELSSGWRFLSSGELDTASSLAESQMEQKEIDGERQDSEALTQLTIINDELAASLQFQCMSWAEGDSVQAADTLRQSLLEYFPDLSEPSAVTIAGSTWMRMECGVTLTPTGTSARQVIWVQVRDGWLMQIAGVAVTSAEPLDSLLETMKPME